jgi:molybdopterin synthase catalytic subunit
MSAPASAAKIAWVLSWRAVSSLSRGCTRTRSRALSRCCCSAASVSARVRGELDLQRAPHRGAFGLQRGIVEARESRRRVASLELETRAQQRMANPLRAVEACRLELVQQRGGAGEVAAAHEFGRCIESRLACGSAVAARRQREQPLHLVRGFSRRGRGLLW